MPWKDNPTVTNVPPNGGSRGWVPLHKDKSVSYNYFSLVISSTTTLQKCSYKIG